MDIPSPPSTRRETPLRRNSAKALPPPAPSQSDRQSRIRFLSRTMRLFPTTLRRLCQRLRRRTPAFRQAAFRNSPLHDKRTPDEWKRAAGLTQIVFCNLAQIIQLLLRPAQPTNLFSLNHLQLTKRKNRS